jgi:DNA/RNA endonuclease YhcR with UshA esterase domain
MKITKVLLMLSFGFVLVAPTQAQKHVTPVEAKDHIGESATVCGSVVSTRYAVSTKGQPTFLNLEKPFPNQIFTVVIWGSNRSRFGTPETRYKGKRICVTGKIADYRGVPEIVASDPEEIKAEQPVP